MNLIKKLTHIYKSKKDPVKYARSLGVAVGKNTRLINIKPLDSTFGSEPYLVTIGNHVTVAADVRFVTHDGGVWVFREKEPDIEVFGAIVIGDNVFIGYGTIIMPGVTVGSNVVIGARSIVTRDIPDNVVVAGSPAKVLKSIDDYYRSLDGRKLNIRNLPNDEKKKILQEKFSKN